MNIHFKLVPVNIHQCSLSLWRIIVKTFIQQLLLYDLFLCISRPAKGQWALREKNALELANLSSRYNGRQTDRQTDRHVYLESCTINSISAFNGGSRRGARGPVPSPPPLFWVKKEEMTEGKKASRASKSRPPPPPPPS